MGTSWSWDPHDRWDPWQRPDSTTRTLLRTSPTWSVRTPARTLRTFSLWPSARTVWTAGSVWTSSKPVWTATRSLRAPTGSVWTTTRSLRALTGPVWTNTGPVWPTTRSPTSALQANATCVAVPTVFQEITFGTAFKNFGTNCETVLV